MSLATRIPRATFVERDDVEAMRPYFASVGASEEFADQLRVTTVGDDYIDVYWDDAGGAMLSAYGVHLVTTSRWIRGLDPGHAKYARNARYGIFRGLLGEPDESGVWLLALRNEDPSHLVLSELSDAERAMREALMSAERRCLCRALEPRARLAYVDFAG